MEIDKAVWHDISNEVRRTYHYSNGFKFTIEGPDSVNISTSSLGGHSHRVKSGHKGYYISPGWVAISWDAPDAVFKF